MNKYLRLLRVEQWYKNLIIFLALFFSQNVFQQDLVKLTIAGFVVLCLTSSASYIFNDMQDLQRDRKHPEKKKRPLAAGEIGMGEAAALALGLLVVSLYAAYQLSPLFSVFPALLFASTMAYTLYFKSKIIWDIHNVAFNYLLRAVSGAVLIGVPTSPWLIMTVFFLALFLALGKRRGEVGLLKQGKVAKEAQAYAIYSPQLLETLTNIVVAVLLFAYSLYTFIAYPADGTPYMMLTIPFASFMAFRYLYLISTGSVVARKTHYIFRDRQMVLALALWILASYLALYG